MSFHLSVLKADRKMTLQPLPVPHDDNTIKYARKNKDYSWTPSGAYYFSLLSNAAPEKVLVVAVITVLGSIQK